MKREPLIYAALLAASLLVAFQTWRGTERDDPASRGIELWHDRPDRIVSIEYTTGPRRLEIRRAGENTATPYLWATSDTSSFVVGADAGKRLLEALATPVAVREFKPTAARRHAFGLDTTRTRLVVRVGDRVRQLLVGARVYSTDERYVLDPAGGRIYVLPQDALQALDNGTLVLPERRLHAFTSDQVATVTVSAGGRARTMRHAGDNPGTGPVWTAPNGPVRPDASFGTFLRRLDGMAIAAYAARENPATLEQVVRVEYVGKSGQPLGFLEVYRRPGTAPQPPEYFARTEVTRVLTRVYAGLMEGVPGDLAQIL